MSSMSSIIGFLDFPTQSWVHNKASTINVDKLVRYSFKTLPLVLNAESDAMVEISMANITSKELKL